MKINKTNWPLFIPLFFIGVFVVDIVLKFRIFDSLGLFSEVISDITLPLLIITAISENFLVYPILLITVILISLYFANKTKNIKRLLASIVLFVFSFLLYCYLCENYIIHMNEQVLIDLTNAIEKYNKDHPNEHFGPRFENSYKDDLIPLVPRYLAKLPKLVHNGYYYTHYDSDVRSDPPVACFTLPSAVVFSDIHCYDLRNNKFYSLD